jgi:hypothetical protein
MCRAPPDRQGPPNARPHRLFQTLAPAGPDMQAMACWDTWPGVACPRGHPHGARVSCTHTGRSPVSARPLQAGQTPPHCLYGRPRARPPSISPGKKPMRTCSYTKVASIQRRGPRVTRRQRGTANRPRGTMRGRPGLQGFVSTPSTKGMRAPFQRPIGADLCCRTLDPRQPVSI